MSNVPVDVYVSTSCPTPVSVTVSAPKFTEKREYYKFVIKKGEIKHLQLSWHLRNFNSSKSSKGVHVEADHEVVVYGVNKQRHCTDGFLAFPTDVLGTRHFAATYNILGNNYYKNDILVTGVHDGTSLSIRLANNPHVLVYFEKQTYSGGNWINNTLDRYDTLQIESIGDLTGSLIQSSMPVTVQTGNKKTVVRRDDDNKGVDHLVEQIPPVDAWGKRFITFRIPLRKVDNLIKLISSSDRTNVSVNACGRASLFYLSEGAFKELAIPASCHAYIEATNAILVIQFVQSLQLKRPNYPQDTDPAMFMVPPIEQYAADYIISLPNATDGFFSNYFLVILEESQKTGLIIDDHPITDTKLQNFVSINGTDYVGGFIFVGKDSDVHTLRHRSQISVFGAVAYGGERVESYAFPVGLRMAPINKVNGFQLQYVL